MKCWTHSMPWCLACGRSDRKRVRGTPFCTGCRAHREPQRTQLIVALTQEALPRFSERERHGGL